MKMLFEAQYKCVFGVENMVPLRKSALAGFALKIHLCTPSYPQKEQWHRMSVPFLLHGSSVPFGRILC